MTYNNPQSAYYKQAKAMKEALPRQLDLAKKGGLGGGGAGRDAGKGKGGDGGKAGSSLKPGTRPFGRPPGNVMGKRLSAGEMSHLNPFVSIYTHGFFGFVLFCFFLFFVFFGYLHRMYILIHLIS